jgi:Tfp pilus assembly major pilin PilA
MQPSNEEHMFPPCLLEFEGQPPERTATAAAAAAAAAAVAATGTQMINRVSCFHTAAGKACIDDVHEA